MNIKGLWQKKPLLYVPYQYIFFISSKSPVRNFYSECRYFALLHSCRYWMFAPEHPAPAFNLNYNYKTGRYTTWKSHKRHFSSNDSLISDVDSRSDYLISMVEETTTDGGLQKAVLQLCSWTLCHPASQWCAQWGGMGGPNCWKTHTKVASWEPKRTLKCLLGSQISMPKCPLGWQNTLNPLGWLKHAKLPSWEPKRILKCPLGCQNTR